MELRVARALYESQNLGAECVPAVAKPTWDNLRGTYWMDDERTSWILKARAAIRAMREPTDDLMLRAGVPRAPSSGAPYEYDTDCIRDVWRAMIDTATAPIQESAPTGDGSEPASHQHS